MILRSRNYIAVPPGETIKELIEDRGIKEGEFATRMEMTDKELKDLISGDVIITPAMAHKLALVLGVPSSFWLNLDSQYREDEKKVREENRLERDKENARNP